MPTSLLATRTRELIANRPVNTTYKLIEQETGVPVRWLERFVSGEQAKADVYYVEAIFTLLNGGPLNVE